MGVEKIQLEVDVAEMRTGVAGTERDFGPYAEWSNRERAIFAAGVVRGLQLAHDRPELAGFERGNEMWLRKKDV